MTDTVLSRPKPAVSPAPLPMPAPIANMKQCLTTAHQLEQMAIQMDKLLASHASDMLQAKDEHQKILRDAEKNHLVVVKNINTKFETAKGQALYRYADMQRKIQEESEQACKAAIDEQNKAEDKANSELSRIQASISAEYQRVNMDAYAAVTARLPGTAQFPILLRSLQQEKKSGLERKLRTNADDIERLQKEVKRIEGRVDAIFNYANIYPAVGGLMILILPFVPIISIISNLQARKPKEDVLKGIGTLLAVGEALLEQGKGEHEKAVDEAHKKCKFQVDTLEMVRQQQLSEAERKQSEVLNIAEQGYKQASSEENQKFASMSHLLVDRFNMHVAQAKSDLENQIQHSMQRGNTVYAELDNAILALESNYACANWHVSAWAAWQPAENLPGCLRVGTAAPNMPRFQHHFPDLPRVEIPALVEYENNSGIVIHAGSALKSARQMAQGAILRLLATVPPSGVRFVFIDPVSLGGNVAGFMPLGEFEASLIGGKAWSDPRHIDEALTEVTNHMETVIQKYLREEYKTIAEYNATARVKEAYRIIVVFDFPVNFSETAAKKLASIMRNGPRCGVFPIVVMDDDKPLPYGFNKQDIEQFALVMQPSGGLVPAPQPRSVPAVDMARAVVGGAGYEEDDDDDYEDEEDDDE